MSDLRKPEIAGSGFSRDLAGQRRLRESVERVGRNLAAGILVLTPIELEQLAQLCVEHFLIVEAARIRRWIPFVERVGGPSMGG